jgi:signal transduction histidine kinase
VNRLLPKSLFGQSLLILLAGLLLSHVVGSWIYTADRAQTVRAVGGFAAAQRIANLAQLVRDSPVEWRDRIIAALNDQTLLVSLSPKPPSFPAEDQDDEIAQVIQRFLTDQLSGKATISVRVKVSAWRSPAFGDAARKMFGPMKGHGPMMQGFGSYRALTVGVLLNDGKWLTFETRLPDSGPVFSYRFLLSMAVMAIITLIVSIWVVRRVTSPLAALAEAAERLGKNVKADPLPIAGTTETQRASQAFNEMQARLQTLVENRMRLLAAISHDLRTPLTSLRLRAENVQDVEQREKLLATIGDLDSIVSSTLEFARDETAGEPQRLIDLTALVQSIVDDMQDLGIVAELETSETLIYECRPSALKRALSNLIDNAVKYGERARISFRTSPEAIRISIDDDGPGIPESELNQVFEPFYRREPSRNRETGGIGLGLAIAQSIVHGHGGEIRLSNRPEGGLRATVVLPR